MKLYAALPRSPWAARVRLAVYARGLNIEICAVPGDGPKSPQYLAINPLGQVPALVLDDGSVIVESEVILEYLEDHFEGDNLRPASPEDRARARMIARVCDLNLLEVGRPLVAQLNPANRDNAVVEQVFAAFGRGLAHLDKFMGVGPYAIGASLSTADCALAPGLAVLQGLILHFRRDLLANHPRIAAYMAFIPSDPHVARIFGEMRQDLAARLNSA